MSRYSRRRVLQGMGAGIALGLAGCSDTQQENTGDFGSGMPDDPANATYTGIGYVEAKRDLEDLRGQLVSVDGWLRFRDNEQWWALDSKGSDSYTRVLETYDLYPEDPSGVENPAQLTSLTVVDDGRVTLPDDAYTRREPYEARVEGRTALLYPELGYGGNNDGKQFNHDDGEPVLKAHDVELLESGN